MPQDTTIYWDGHGQIPVVIDTLPLQQRQEVLEAIHRLKEEVSYSDPSGTYMFLLVFIVLFSAAAIYSNKKTKRLAKANPLSNADDAMPAPIQQTTALVYSGNNLDFSDELITEVLTRRFRFYKQLNEEDKLKFIRRLKKFMALKTFVIHDTGGFKEMPLLVCATAVQICFGLDKYLLPNFDTFNIYPQEFISTHPSLRVLIGNVTGNTINLSWKHFLDGFQYGEDGQNVGIHELAHALYYQTFVVEKNVDREFRDSFVDFNNYGNKVYDLEKLPGPGLYSEYAIRDFQEFWAESVEIFFERPVQMKTVYPELYAAMSGLLNQDPSTAWLGNII
ncbi:MAG: zinc-dependent peptidase [Ferruginibacter sp.]